jgi:hypothetical protein
MAGIDLPVQAWNTDVSHALLWLAQKRKGGHVGRPSLGWLRLDYCAGRRRRAGAFFSGAGGMPSFRVIIFGFCEYESKVAL